MPHLTPSEVKGLFLEVLGEMQDEGVIGDKTRQERDEDDHNGEGQQDDQDGRRGREEDEDQVSNEEDDSEIDDSQILHGYVLLRDGVRAPHPLRSSGESLEDTPADLINTTLFPHQREAVGRLASLEASRYKGGILADEMGLGKTITLVALMLVRRTEPRHPTLVIVPPALLSMWTHELTTRAPSLKPYVWHGKRAKSITSTDLVREHHVVLTTYPMVRGQMKDMDRAENSDKQCSIPIMAILWGRIILDEAHTIRNIETNISIAVQSLQSSTRIAATGTPLQNEYSDVYSLLAFLNITPLSDYGFFKAVS
jgi:SNF2 family DNA or RNA helicase